MLRCLPQVLQQLVAAGNHKSHPFHRRPIVLLADVEKDLLNQQVAEVLSRGGTSSRHIEVHTR